MIFDVDDYGLRGLELLIFWCFQAMVSGAIGGFLDVAFNFNTQALLDDNLLGIYWVFFVNVSCLQTYVV